MLDKYPNDVKIVFKNFPLRNHKLAKPAAIGALAAGKQGKFWEYHDEVFANYNSLDYKKLQDFAEKIGLDMDKFNKDKEDPQLDLAVNRDLQDGSRAGVRGTPTLFVNGRLLKQRSLQGFQVMIDKELAKGKK